MCSHCPSPLARGRAYPAPSPVAVTCHAIRAEAAQELACRKPGGTLLSPIVAALVLTLIGMTPGASAEAAPLRVCAEANNLPFSNVRQEGFENEIAQVLAHELGTTLEFSWRAAPRHFIKKTLAAGLCDLVIGVPAGLQSVLTTRPYYRSTYVFVSRADAGTPIRSIEDPRLRHIRIGVQLMGDDQATTPPAQALARRGIVENIRGYMLFDDTAAENPPARIIDAVARGDIDVAIAWGPLAGYFGPRQSVPLQMVPVWPASDPPGLPFTFAIAMAVRKNDQILRDRVQQAIDARHSEIDRILDRYGVPRVPTAARRR